MRTSIRGEAIFKHVIVFSKQRLPKVIYATLPSFVEVNLLAFQSLEENKFNKAHLL